MKISKYELEKTKYKFENRGTGFIHTQEIHPVPDRQELWFISPLGDASSRSLPLIHSPNDRTMTNKSKRVTTNNNNNSQWSLSTLMCSCCCKSNSYCSDDDYENENSRYEREKNKNPEIAYLINDTCRHTVVLEDNVFDEADDKSFPHPILVADYWTSIDRRLSRRLFGSDNNNGQEVSFCKSPTKSDISSSSIYSPSTKRRIMNLLNKRKTILGIFTDGGGHAEISLTPFGSLL
uniref:Uncharacterized protein n=1 Tax=Romanomermis culicivorax TaxID=13658 RepID=A0A915J5L9_ROMCU